MRIIIFSDVHANLEALAALHQVEKPPDALFFLGDMVGYGPDPAPCVGWIRAYATHAVRGDHDAATATRGNFGSPPELRDLAIATREHTIRQLPARDLAYLGKLPDKIEVELGGAKFFLAHGSPREPVTCLFDFATTSENTLRAELEGVDADVILLGHTHVPAIRKIGNKYLVNPGSLGQPRHGLPSATFAVWNDGNLRIHHIDYDPKPTQAKVGLMPLEPEMKERLQEILSKGM